MCLEHWEFSHIRVMVIDFLSVFYICREEFLDADGSRQVSGAV